jgi:hypothetical protein
VCIYVKTWGQVLDENRSRMKFFQERLEYQADKGASLKHLQEHYAKYLEGVFDNDPGQLDAASEPPEGKAADPAEATAAK